MAVDGDTTPHREGTVIRWKAALAAVTACASLSALASNDAERGADGLQSRADAQGTVTYWGDGAHYEITGPGVTVFFLRRADGRLVAPLIRVAYVGDQWINLRGVSFTVGERAFGPFLDGFGKPARIEASGSLVVEALILQVDSDEKWQMLEGIAEAAELGRPVIAVLEADAPYGIELDRAAKGATRQVVTGFRGVSARAD
jgi:hypothetical protein